MYSKTLQRSFHILKNCSVFVLFFFLHACHIKHATSSCTGFLQPDMGPPCSESGNTAAIETLDTPQVQHESVPSSVLLEEATTGPGPSTLPCLQHGDTSQLETGQRFKNYHDSASNSTLSFSESQKQSSSTEQCARGMSSRQQSQECAQLEKPVPTPQQRTGCISKHTGSRFAGKYQYCIFMLSLLKGKRNYNFYELSR